MLRNGNALGVIEQTLLTICRKSGGETVLAGFPWSDYASNSTNIGWLARTGHIIGVALLHVSGVVRTAEFPPAALQWDHVFKVRSSRSFSWIEAMHTLRRLLVLHNTTSSSPSVWDEFSLGSAILSAECFQIYDDRSKHNIRACVAGLLIVIFMSRASFNIRTFSELEPLLPQLGSDELNVLAVRIGAQYEREYSGDDQEFRNHILIPKACSNMHASQIWEQAR